MDSYDIKREFKSLYAPRGTDFEEVDVPEIPHIAVDGAGNPNTSPAYAEALEALYPVAYALKFAHKARGRDCVVGPLEGLWWADDLSTFVSRDKDAWRWTMLITVAPWTTEDDFRAAVDKSAKKDLPALGLVRFSSLVEGRCLQILHLGPYDDEGPTLRRLHEEVMPARGLTFNGRHHEIYLSDPRRTAPEKLKTVLRQPVAPG